MPRKRLDHFWIVHVGEEEKQGSTTKPQTNKRTNFFEVRSDHLRLQMIQSISTSVIMSLSIFCSNKASDLVAKSYQTKQIALLFRDKSQYQRRGNKTF